ncbi:MAG: hypothetical protein HPY55_07325 [Firmicutes bacterium]|nr:hypothetical protein [Bacillota bacterium]
MTRLSAVIVQLVDALFTLVSRCRLVDPSGAGLLLVSYHSYNGPSFVIPDGTAVARGALVGELHLASRRIARSATAGLRSEWDLLLTLRREICVLAGRAAAGDPLHPPVVAFYGVTTLGAGAQRLGFHCRPVPASMRSTLIRWWETRLARAYAAPFARPRRGRPLTEVWLSARALVGLAVSRSGAQKTSPENMPNATPISLLH